MSVELHRDSPIFDKGISVRQCQGAFESRNAPLDFRIIPGTRALTGVQSSGQSERLFHFEVADENDPYFLYILDVGEQDFHLLKKDQALLVEFPVFPTKMVDLLQLCLESEQSQRLAASRATGDSEALAENIDHNANGSNAPSTFIAKLDTTSGVFSVVELNEFKQLTHISLQMRQGNDNAIKSYLASRLCLYMNRCELMTRELGTTTKSLQTEKKEKQEIQAALVEIQSFKAVNEESLRSAHTNEIAQLQMTLMNAADNERKRFENQLDNSRKETELLRVELKQKTLETEEGMLELKRQKQHLEFRERELARLLETAEGDKDRVFQECKEIAAARRAADDACSQLERQLARSGAQIEALNLQVTDRDEMVQVSKNMQRAAEDARKLLAEKLDIYIADADNLREKIKLGGAEITRGNAVIQRLQIDKKTLTEKVKLKSEVIRKQELVVQELQSKIAEYERLLLSERDATKLAVAQYESVKGKLEEAVGRLTESSQIIATNKEVIAYLNEEINKWQLGLRTGTEGIAIGSGIGVTSSVKPSKWANFDQNATESSAQMFSPDTTRDISYGGYHPNSHTALNMTTDKLLGNSRTAGYATQQLDALGFSDASFEGGSGLENLEYYADAEAKMNVSNITRSSAAGGVTKYAWQAEDFGLETDSSK